jgi:hypothetical protein
VPEPCRCAGFWGMRRQRLSSSASLLVPFGPV